MHSVMNYLFSKQILSKQKEKLNKREFFERLSQPENSKDRKLISDLATKQGMTYLADQSGTNIDVQIFDLSKVDFSDSYLSEVIDDTKIGRASCRERV